MILSCPACPKTYDVPASALPPGGREVACSACETVWFERGQMARAVAAGAAGADVAPGWDGVIDAEFQPVGATRPRPAPRPVPAETADARDPANEARDAVMPAPSPARAQQTALTVAYGADAVDAAEPERGGPDAEAARAAARVLSDHAAAQLRGVRDRALGLAGVALGTLLDLHERLRPAAPSGAAETPGDAAARRTRERMRARAVNALTPARVLGWLAWGVTLGGLLFVLATKDAAVRAVFPPSAHLYDAFAPPAPAKGLRAVGELRGYALSSQGPAITVAGAITNDGDEAAVPFVTLTVTTPGGEVAQPVSLPPVALPPGGERPFTVRALVPEGSSAVRLSVAPGIATRDGLTLQPTGGGWQANGHAGPPTLGAARDAGPGGAPGAAPR